MWVENKQGFYVCSICSREAYWDTDYGQQLFDYCPYCGAYSRIPLELKHGKVRKVKHRAGKNR